MIFCVKNSAAAITAAEGITLLKQQMKEIGYEVVVGRGDFGKEKEDD